MVRERALIAHIRRLAQSSSAKGVIQGIGDDCAILRLRLDLNCWSLQTSALKTYISGELGTRLLP